MTDATWTNLINAVVTVLLAYIAYRQQQLKTQCKDVADAVSEVKDKAIVAAIKSEQRTDKLDVLTTKIEEIHNSIPPNFKP